MASATLGPRDSGWHEAVRPSAAGEAAFRAPPPRRNVVVIAGSAGAITAVRRLVATLPASLAAAVVVVIHLPPRVQSTLPHILSRAGPLPAIHAGDKDPIVPGRIIVAPPDYHVVVGRRHTHLNHGPPELGHRPSADMLFRSAARNHGARVVGVILSGLMGDGASGMAAIVRCGGVGIVQDPLEAEFPAMPEHAIDIGAPQHVVKLDDIARTVVAALEVTAPSARERAGRVRSVARGAGG